ARAAEALDIGQSDALQIVAGGLAGDAGHEAGRIRLRPVVTDLVGVELRTDIAADDQASAAAIEMETERSRAGFLDTAAHIDMQAVDLHVGREQLDRPARARAGEAPPAPIAPPPPRPPLPPL